MSRITGRISAAMAKVKCPGCGKWVVPTISAPGGSGPAPPPPSGKRWSFIWRPPSGKVCPECFFPLERHARRLKWVHTATLGLVLEVTALFLLILSLLDREGQWAGGAARVLAGVGAVLLVVGVVGVIVGGRSASDASEGGSA